MSLRVGIAGSCVTAGLAAASAVCDGFRVTATSKLRSWVDYKSAAVVDGQCCGPALATGVVHRQVPAAPPAAAAAAAAPRTAQLHRSVSQHLYEIVRQ